MTRKKVTQLPDLRTLVIVSAAHLEDVLGELIAAFLVDDPGLVSDLLGDDSKLDRPLGSLGARIKAAYCLGLITHQELQILEAIRHIRNYAAHHGFHFDLDAPDVRKWCDRLAQLFNVQVDLLWLESAIQSLILDLSFRKSEVSKQRRTAYELPAPPSLEGAPDFNQILYTQDDLIALETYFGGFLDPKLVETFRRALAIQYPHIPITDEMVYGKFDMFRPGWLRRGCRRDRAGAQQTIWLTGVCIEKEENRIISIGSRNRKP